MIQPLSSCSDIELEEGQEQIIKPLFQPNEPVPEKKEVTMQEYVDTQCNAVVAFVINWVRRSFFKDLIQWLRTEYKQEIIKELHATNR